MLSQAVSGKRDALVHESLERYAGLFRCVPGGSSLLALLPKDPPTAHASGESKDSFSLWCLTLQELVMAALKACSLDYDVKDHDMIEEADLVPVRGPRHCHPGLGLLPACHLL
jgi:hypothetical protein